MNKRELQIKRKDIMSKVKKHNGVNCVKCWGGTTKKHFMVISEICYYINSIGFEFYTEVEFNKGGRADIFAISPEAEGIIIEVLHSEKEEKFLKKLKKYPFRIIKIKTKDFIVDKLDLSDFK